MRTSPEDRESMLREENRRLREQLEAQKSYLLEREAFWFAKATQAKEQLETLRKALTKAPFPSGHDPDYVYWFHNGRRDALDGSNPAIGGDAHDRNL